MSDVTDRGRWGASPSAARELLIAVGADPAQKNTAGRTEAEWARTGGMVDIAERLERDLH